MTDRTPKLYIFPHAGGSPQYYVPFSKTFTTDVKRIGVQYPGKGGTHDLGAFTSIEDLADQVCKTVAPLGPRPTGRSSSSDTAWVRCWRSKWRADSRPTATGSPRCSCPRPAAPGRAGHDNIPESDRGLLEAVSTMTGVNPEFLENEEFAAKILPTLRGLKAIANYDCPPEAKVSCPIFAFHGDEDDVATEEKVGPWAERTTAEFSARVFTAPGHHFYLTEHLPELVGDIEKKIAQYCQG